MKQTKEYHCQYTISLRTQCLILLSKIYMEQQTILNIRTTMNEETERKMNDLQELYNIIQTIYQYPTKIDDDTIERLQTKFVKYNDYTKPIFEYIE